MDSTGVDSSMRKEDEDGALLVGMYSRGSESSMRKEAEEESGKRSDMVGMISEMPWDAEDAKDKKQLLKKWEHRMKEIEEVKQENGKQQQALVAREEARVAKCIVASEDELLTKENPSNRGEEAAMEGSGKSAMDEELSSPETDKGIVLPMMSNKLDHGGDEEKGEMDMGESAIQEDSSTTVVDPSSTNSITVQDDHDLEMDFEAGRFASHRRSWDSNWGKTCGSFEDITVLTSMQLTHLTPGLVGGPDYNTGTLQIFSIKFTDIAGGLQLPLSVYGVVAIRDIVDCNRNILFYCTRSEAQEVKQNDPFLHLFGPSRAIVSTDKVYIEIELKVKGALESQDKPLMTCVKGVLESQDKPLMTCVRGHKGLSTMCFKNNLCTLELCSQQVRRTVQATILGVRVVKGEGSWPLNFKYGGLVACTPLSGKFVFSNGGLTRIKNSSSNKIVLLDSKDGPMPEGVDGYLHLWRQVVSVEFEGGLDVVIQAYSESGGIAAESCVHFVPKNCNTSRKKISLGDAQVTITVAWSLVLTDNLAAGKLAKKKHTNMWMEGGSGKLMLMGQQSNEIDRGKSAIEEDSKTTMVDPSSTNSMTTQDDDHDLERDFEAERFALHRRSWESNWGKKCGSFEDITVLTSMQFTHHTPGLIPLGSAGYMTGTLQILSIKLTDIAGGFKLPLSVYGVIATRDVVDRNRNILFKYSRSEAQELNQNDPFLHLNGPSRAIVNTDEVDIEIKLRVKGAVKSQDKPLMTCVRSHSSLSTMCFKNDLCTLELCSQRVRRTVQVTILDFQVVKRIGSCPLNFKYGGLVACTPLSGEFVFSDGVLTRKTNPSSNKIVLLESKDGPMPEGVLGYLHLWRQVVSVEFEGGLDVFIQAYSESGGIAVESCVHFMPKQSNVSQKKCVLGDAEVIITVAWSLVPMDKNEVVSEVGRRG